MFDFTRQRAALPVGPDIQAVPTPLTAPPNPDGGAGTPGLSAGSVSALSGLASAIGGKLGQHGGGDQMYDAPMPMKRQPFQQLGPPMEFA